MPNFLSPGDFAQGSFCNQCGEDWTHMVQNPDSSYTCTVCAAHHRDGPSAPLDILTKPTPHLKRGERRTYNPRNYLYSVLVKGFGCGKHKIDNTVLQFLYEQGVKEVQDIREMMRSMGLGYKHHAFAASYAQRLGGHVPEFDRDTYTKLLDSHDHFLQRFNELKNDGRLPHSRKHEPHTGMTIRRIAHRIGLHTVEPAFRDLKSRQKKKTEEIITAVFLDLGWGHPETCD